ncbi:hypothetical protein V1515DRAFT_69726 [Lipomyces mesembrius]
MIYNLHFNRIVTINTIPLLKEEIKTFGNQLTDTFSLNTFRGLPPPLPLLLLPILSSTSATILKLLSASFTRSRKIFIPSFRTSSCFARVCPSSSSFCRSRPRNASRSNSTSRILLRKLALSSSTIAIRFATPSASRSSAAFSFSNFSREPLSCFNSARSTIISASFFFIIPSNLLVVCERLTICSRSSWFTRTAACICLLLLSNRRFYSISI